MVNELDELDLKIIHELHLDGRVSVTELAMRISASRPTITSRLKRLIDENLVVIAGGLNLREFGFKMAHIGLEVKTDETRKEFEHYLKKCPRVLYVFRTPEKANIQFSIWGEDAQTINSTIESFRDRQNIDIVYTHYLETPIHGDIIISVEPSENIVTPCGLNCSDCHRHINSWCIGCPASSDYKNPLLTVTK